MHTHRCVLIEISMEIGMLNFWLGLLVTVLMKETYFSTLYSFNIMRQKYNIKTWFRIDIPIKHSFVHFDKCLLEDHHDYKIW